jgi:hypothetical protein
MKTLTLSAVRQTRLSHAHAEYLSTAIARYRDKAIRALKLAKEAAGHGNRALAAGLLDEAAAFQAMANGLADQSRAADAQEAQP